MKWTISLLLFICFSEAKSQTDLPDNYFLQTLNNGLQILVIENNYLPVATISTCIRNGASYESDSVSGTAYVLDKLFFGANHDYPVPGTLNAKLQSLGIKTNVQTDLCGSEFQMNMPVKNWQVALSILNGALRTPLYPDDEIQNAISETEQEYQQIKIDPFYLLNDEMNHSLWSSAYASQNMLGSYHVIKNLNYTSLMNYHNEAYIPFRTLIIIAGAVNHLDVFTKASALFNDWKNPTLQSSVQTIPSFKPLQYSSQFVTTTPLSPAPSFLFSFQLPGIKEQEEVSTEAMVFTQMMNESGSSFKNNLVSKGFAQNAEINFTNNRYGNSLNFFMIGNTTNLQSGYSELMKQFTLATQYSYYSQSTLDAAKKHLVQDYKFKNEKLNDVVHNISLAWLKKNVMFYLSFEDRINAISIDDLVNFNSQFINQKKYVAGLLISPSIKQMLQTDLFFIETNGGDEFDFSFTRNATDFMGVDNESKLLELIQWMKINPEASFQLYAYQDALERKETARDRFVEMYKEMISQGVSNDLMKSIPVSVYIQHGTTDAEIEMNQKVVFKILN